ncbi:hypothetical protein FRB93_006059 [Tulasnella sp. JGI-2019a]|nr:hypothetical protein FRB93_006059 [Tulasnella sp. JGI-2019a]
MPSPRMGDLPFILHSVHLSHLFCFLQLLSVAWSAPLLPAGTVTRTHTLDRRGGPWSEFISKFKPKRIPVDVEQSVMKKPKSSIRKKIAGFFKKPKATTVDTTPPVLGLRDFDIKPVYKDYYGKEIKGPFARLVAMNSENGNYREVAILESHIRAMETVRLGKADAATIARVKTLTTSAIPGVAESAEMAILLHDVRLNRASLGDIRKATQLRSDLDPEIKRAADEAFDHRASPS